MTVFLYDTLEALPEDEGNHILVYAGRGSLMQAGITEMVTEIICTFRFGDTCVQFPHNGDAANVRFEQAFSWAVKYADAQDIENVYGVFELSRPLDQNHMHRICSDGIVDRRVRDLYAKDVSPSAPRCPKCSAPLSTGNVAPVTPRTPDKVSLVLSV